MMCGLVVACMGMSAQQQFYSVFNRVGLSVGAGTEGISVSVGAPLTAYLEFGMGMNVVPGIKIKGDIDVGTATYSSTTVPLGEVEVEGNLARTTFDFKAHCYPFGSRGKFFLAAGFSFGGKELCDVTGHSDEVEAYLRANPEARGSIVAALDDYNLTFDDNGDLRGNIEVSGFRPYLGLGFGRLVPKHRIGVRFELGCHFHGKPKVMQDGQEVPTDKWSDGDNDLSKIVEKVSVYPVLKLSLVGRIL